MTPLASNPTVRIWREASTGRIMQTENNISPEVKVEVVNVPDGKCIATIDDEIEGSYPFKGYPVPPVFRS